MKPRYQARKKIVAGRTNHRRLRTSSWNSGERSIASQSTRRLSASAVSSLVDRSNLRRVSYPRFAADALCGIAQRSIWIDERCLWRDERRRPPRDGSMLARQRVDVALGVVLGMALAASLAAGWRLVRAPRACRTRRARRCRRAVHAATSLLPHLRRGLDAESAPPAAPHLRVLTGAGAVALADRERAAGVRRARAPTTTAPATRSSRSPARCATTACTSSRGCTARHPGCPLRSAIVAPLRRAASAASGALVALYDRPGRLRLEETRVVGEAAALVSAMVELSEIEAQGERLARAELRALRAQISPHFIYNALAAVAVVHPLAAGGGARAADRVRRVHPLRVRAPARRT